MSRFKRTIYNCRQATFLIEKKQLTRLTWKEQIDLKIHLTGCSVCRLYQQQSIFITKLTKNIFQTEEKSKVKLDDTFKANLQERIVNELDKT